MVAKKVSQEARKCPDCEAPMKLRKGPYSRFFGCSRYPYCKCTVKPTAAELDAIDGRAVNRKKAASVPSGKRKNARGWNGRHRRNPADARTEAMMDAEFRAIIS